MWRSSWSNNISKFVQKIKQHFQIKDLDHLHYFGSLIVSSLKGITFALELVDDYALLCLLDLYLDDDAIMIGYHWYHNIKLNSKSHLWIWLSNLFLKFDYSRHEYDIAKEIQPDENMVHHKHIALLFSFCYKKLHL